jgi:hypothetical protein
MRRFASVFIGVTLTTMVLAVPAAHASTVQVTCTNSSGTVVLKIKASSAATNGLQRAMAAAKVAESTLGVTCSDSTGTTVTVPDSVTVLCVNSANVVKLKFAANKAAFKGLGIAVAAFAKHAGKVLGLSCTVS